MSVLMFKSIHGLVPDYLANVITMQIEVSNNRETRHVMKIMYMSQVSTLNLPKGFSYILVLLSGTLYLTPLKSVAVWMFLKKRRGSIFILHHYNCFIYTLAFICYF